jgi:hypothetical protein
MANKIKQANLRAEENKNRTKKGDQTNWYLIGGVIVFLGILLGSGFVGKL